ncbi:hypothetical protein GCM10009530_26100 [Microbispora corallina]|uniref:Glycosyltransferase RgtA/B/C/D-like domain-containing protein n=1 Tax=Microbispora corallina TaxID=83302 RepID=A0ABQ4G4T2_9ACTN|nr:hypothetical protein [Microbispora corallina]GIH42092.1 hypothetical protein Mco01_50920 [Microbispora corallina]
MVVLLRYGVTPRDLLVFAVYVAFGLALPGVLLVRALHGGRRTLAEEIAFGLALGYALEVCSYIAARAAGLPLLVLVWPTATYALFLFVPRLRPHWKSPPRRHAPLWWSWALALIMIYLVAWGAVSYFALTPLTWPALGTAAPDVPFHLSLIGELKNHVPPTMPMVAGEPLSYHWFVYAHFAASSQITGIEPLILLSRLGVVPMLAALITLIALNGRRVTGSWTGGLLATAATIFVATPSLYLGKDIGSFTWGGIPDLAWWSPTQTFGSLLFAPLVIVLIEILQQRARSAGGWLLLTLLTAALTGAKATYLPMLAVGLVTVAVVETIRERRLSRHTAGALCITAMGLAFSQFVLYAGTRGALVVSPFYFIRTTWRALTGIAGQEQPTASSLIGMTLVVLLGWLVVWSGILGLLARPRLLARQAVPLMLGFGGIGFGTALFLAHPSLSQFFFLWGAYPYLAILAILGLRELVARAGVSRRAVLSAAACGLLSVYLIPVLCGVRVPVPPERDTLLFLPYIVLAIAAASAGVVLIVKAGWIRAWALTTVAFAAIGLPADLHARVLATVFPLAGEHAGEAGRTSAPAAEGLMAAGRWLRDHSGPGDLVATNAHCRWGLESPCDSRQFWASALSERRMLVEGWAFTFTSENRWHPGLTVAQIPFWDRERIRLNDAAFRSPTAAVMQDLRRRYHVRWLLAENGHLAGVSPELGDFATLVFRSGDCSVYRLADG